MTSTTLTPMTKQILCTLGPSSLNEEVISRLDALGVTLFRVNLSHTRIEDVEKVVGEIQSLTETPLCLDTEGAQVRTGSMAGGAIHVEENATIVVQGTPVDGDIRRFSFYPEGVVERLEVGDLISIDFDSVLVQVVDLRSDEAELQVLNGGSIGSNKAVSLLNRSFELPPLTNKDLQALKIGAEMGLVNAALSFANRADDVVQLREAFREDGFVISKIECRNGIRNLDEILDASDAALIDRGDLSREYPIEQIPILQKQIIARGKSLDVPIYVATNLLESMVSARTPTRAEVNDIYNTIIDGASGLVLAAETAIGDYPVRCAEMVIRIIREAEQEPADLQTKYEVDATLGLMEPHGGRLINRVAQAPGEIVIDGLPRVAIDYDDLMDCEQIAVGTYSPLTGFMNRDELRAVLDDNQLPSGLTWTLPILLQIAKSELHGAGVGDRVVLENRSGEAYALLDISDIFELDLEDVAQKWFGTISRDHPGVARLHARGATAIGGDITLLRSLQTSERDSAYTPAQTRLIFRHKGWGRVIAFHTRNVAHRVHEYLQLRALEDVHADGLYLNPVAGSKKSGDFLTEPILESYRILIREGVYPKNKVLLGSFLTYSRYSGPREALFTALCRKNMGCSHFIIGRDHTGVGDFYPPEANIRFFEKHGDIGITPLFYNELGYDADTSTYKEVGSGSSISSISGTDVRDTLRTGDRLPEWVIRPSVQDHLLSHMASGQPLFHQ